MKTGWLRAALVTGVAVIWLRLVTIALSQVLTTSNPDLAIRLYGGNSIALVTRAERALAQQPPDFVAARADAEKALRADPLSPRAHRILATIAEAEGLPADLLWDIALKSLRDTTAQARSFALAAQAKDWESAFSRLDLVYRTQPTSWAAINRAVVQMMSDPDFTAGLGRWLARNPAWRENFMGQAIREAPDPGPLAALIDALRGDGGLREVEFRAYLNRLVNSRQYDVAHRIFLEHLSPDLRNEARLFYNANFEHGQSNLPFDWVIERSQSALIAIRSENGRNVLKVDFFGGQAPFRNVSHLLVLSPGSYRFSGEEQARDLRNEIGLSWRLYCVGKEGGPIASTPNLRGDVDWRAFTVDIQVPDEGCPVQNIVLEIPARFASQQEASGGASFASFSLAPFSNQRGER